MVHVESTCTPEQLFLAETKISQFLQSLGLEISNINSFEYLKPVRIAMDDAPHGRTTEWHPTGLIIVDVRITGLYLLQCTVDDEEVVNCKWEFYTQDGMYYTSVNKEEFFKFKKQLLN
jgi:hypothetical protein